MYHQIRFIICTRKYILIVCYFVIVDVNIFHIRLVQIRQLAWNKVKTVYTFESKEVLKVPFGSIQLIVIVAKKELLWNQMDPTNRSSNY